MSGLPPNLVTVDLLRAMGASAKKATEYEPYLQAAAAKYKINTPLRVCHWLAQVFEESGSLVYTREIWGPTPAQKRYETRADLGNTPELDGDGYWNRGVGLIQTTGEDNIEEVLAALGLPPNSNDLLAQPKWAAMSAGYYWDDRKLNAIADQTPPDREGIERTVARITKKVNGGYNHFDRRQANFDRGMAYMARTYL